MCEKCFPPGFVPSEGDVDDHIEVRRGERVRIHTTNGMTGNAEVLHVGPVGLRLEMLSLKIGDSDQRFPGELDQFVIVVPWPQIRSLHIDPVDPWPNERKFVRKATRKYGHSDGPSDDHGKSDR